MARKDWYISDDIRRLESNPGAWNFFQGIRRLECADKRNPRIGSSVNPGKDPVRFGQKATLAFTPNDIHSYSKNGDGEVPEMNVNCFGLLGSNGSVPLFLTEYIYQRIKHHNDRALINFINMFHHRMTSFLYRSWAIYQPTVSCDREDDDYILRILKSLTGCDYILSSSKNGIKDYVQSFYSGYLAKFVQGRGSLISILYDYFDVPVKLEELFGKWKNIDKKYLCRMGELPEISTLGEGMVMGEKCWDCKKKFRIKLGPMPYEKYVQFLPGQDAFKHLVEWVKKFNRSNLEWDLQLILSSEEVKPSGEGTLLGYTGWMLSKENKVDREDLIIENPEEKY